MLIPQVSTNRWPIFITSLGLVFLAFTGWSFYRAAVGVSGVTDPAYYRHGLKYAEGQIEEQAVKAMGWRMAPEVQDGQLRIRLSGPGNTPLTGGEGEISLLTGHQEGAGRQQFPLRETSAGLYASALPASLHGDQTAEFTFRQGRASLHRRLVFRL